jgi:pyrimidine 5'-nucleotidase
MVIYMEMKLGLPLEEIAELRRRYYEIYGTTLRGLQLHHQIDTDEFLAFVHDLPIQQMVRPDPDLREMLLALHLRKFIFTNADTAHAGRILAALGVADCFDGISDLRARDFYCKPDLEAYRRALVQSGETTPENCLYLDDATRNLIPARELGMYAVLVGSHEPDPAADITIPRPHDLRTVLPELWGDGSHEAKKRMVHE